MVKFEDIVLYYEYFYKKTKQSEKYKFIPSEKSKKIIVKFLSTLDKRYNLKTLGNNYLWKYFNFQFKYWDELTITAFWGKMQIEYIIGDKAFQRYLDRNKEFDFTLESENNELVKKYNLRLSELTVSKKVNKSKRTDLFIKKSFYNTERGFATCLMLTTLFNPNHSICLTCNYKPQCKELLKANYPQIYESRGLK